jgi:broad specificity phosphatase PhoE
MRSLIALLLLLFVQQSMVAQVPGWADKHTKVYIVRHGEKEAGKDPVLTPAGMQRAEDLYQLLKNKDIARIYATPYKRTQMTGDSLRVKLSIDTSIYAADTVGTDLIQKIISHNDKGKNILIIGHSNTVPALVRHLGVGDFEIKELSESSFDNIFLITYKKRKPVVKRMKYGAASVVGASAK